MLGIFRTNQILASVFILIYLAVLHASDFILGFPEQSNPSAGILGHTLLNWADTWPSIWRSIAVILITFLEGILLIVLVNNHRMNKEVNLFPGLLFALLACSLPSFLPLTAPLLGALFLILAIQAMFRVSKKTDSTAYIFNVGFWLGLGSLIYFPLIYFYFWGIICIGILQSTRFRDYLVLLTGVLVPYILVATWYFWYDQFDLFYQLQFLGNMGLVELFVPNSALEWTALIVILLIVFLVLFSNNAYKQKQSIAVQKRVNVLYYSLLFVILGAFLQAGLDWPHLILFFPALAILLAINFTLMSRQWAEIVHLLVLIAVLLLQYQPLLAS